MKKQIKDYLPYYIGAQVYIPKYGYRYIFGVSQEGLSHTNTASWAVYEEFDKLGDAKIVLRPLSDITEEEAKHITVQIYKHDFYNDIEELKANGYYDYVDYVRRFEEWYSQSLEMEVGNPEVWHYLLSRHFDLFDLIDTELAIDKTKLK